MAPETDLAVQRKLLEILRIIHENNEPIGARLIADRLNERGYPIGERGVRYHLRILDERGLTKRLGYDGRVITEKGLKELREARVGDRLGFIITKIERLIYETTFNPEKREGRVIINTSIIDKNDIEKTLEVLTLVAQSGYTLSPYIHIIEEGTITRDIRIPEGKIGIATICSITVDGILLKNGIPVDPKYGGILMLENGKPVHFLDLILYSGTSIDPMTVFMSRKMTSVLSVLYSGSGRVLANLREIPIAAREDARRVLEQTREAGICGIIDIGHPSRPVLGAPIEIGKIGIPVYAGVNAVAAAEERGISIRTDPISTTMEYKHMRKL